MAHSALAIANRLLDKAGPSGLDPMKLIKLAYLSQGWMLGLYGEPLTWSDVEAWRYGPVFREIYRHVAGKPIIQHKLPTLDRQAFSSHEEHLIDQVLQKYGSLTGIQLSALTHASGSPWDVTYRRFGQNSVIPKELIRDYYAAMVPNARHEREPA